LAYAIDLGGSHARCAIVEDTSVRVAKTVPVRPGTKLGSILPELASALEASRDQAGVAATAISGVAVSSCGIVDARIGRVLSTNHKYDDAPEIDLVQWARNQFGLELRIENDARMALLGEQYAGAAKGFSDVVMFTLGTGIGGAAMIEGQLLRGKHAQAGCLAGHVPVTLQGRPCTCGGVGCAESEASGWALRQISEEWPGFAQSALSQNEINFENLFHHAAAGDQVAKDIREHCLRVWSMTALAAVHNFDPEIVVFGGGVMRSAEVILPFVQEYVWRNAWTPWGKVGFRAALLGDDAPLLGAIPLLTRTDLSGDARVR
jgi:glucokinase